MISVIIFLQIYDFRDGKGVGLLISYTMQFETYLPNGYSRAMTKGEEYSCPVEAAIDIIGGKWKPWIIWCLRDGEERFSELQKRMPCASSKMLTKQLRELEQDGILSRKIYPVIPPKVEYSLTPFGKTAIPLVETLCEWGSKYLNLNESCTRG